MAIFHPFALVRLVPDAGTLWLAARKINRHVFEDRANPALGPDQRGEPQVKVGCANDIVRNFIPVGAEPIGAEGKQIPPNVARITARGDWTEVRCAYGSVGPTVVRAREVESILTGPPPDPDRIARAQQAARRAVCPIDDLRASAEYRRAVAGNLLYRLLDPP